MHGDRVAVRQPGRDPALAHRALTDRVGGILAQPFGGDHLLDGHLAVEELIAGQPHRAHAATTDPGQQAVSPGNQVLRTWHAGVVGNR